MNYVEYDESNLQSFEITQKAISNGSLIGTCELGTAEIEMINNSNEYSEFKNKWIKSPFGSLYVYNVEPKQEKVSIKMSCYDIKTLMDAEYKQSDFEILFPCTIVSWRNAIASSLGLQFNDGNVFPNSNFTLTKHPYIEDKSSCRDVMKIIAQACASWVESDSNDKLYFKWINDNEIVIPDWLELTTEKTSTEPVNMVVLGRGDVEDIEIYPNPKPDNPVEFRIDNNYILDPQDTTTTEDRRKDVIQPIYNRVNGFTYIPFTMRTQSVENTFDVKLGTKVKYIDIWENELTSIVMSRTLKWLGNDINNQNNYELSISAEDIKETSSDYQKARPADKITQLEVSVDKQNELIKINATNIEENKKDLADITVTTKEIKASVESLDENFQTEITTRKTASGNPTYISDSGGYALEKDFIYGMSIQEISTQNDNLVFFKEDRVLAKANTLNYTINNYNDIDISYTGTATYPAIAFEIDNSLLTEGTWYLGGMVTEINNPSDRAIINISKINKETGVRDEFKELNFTSSNLNTIRAYDFTIANLDTHYYRVQLYANGSVAGTNGTTYSAKFANVFVSKKNEFVESIPNSPTPEFPSEIINNRGIENLIDIPKGTQIRNGVEVSVDDDYVITLNGTCTTDRTTFKFNNEGKDNFLDGIYTLHYQYISGSISGNTSTCAIQVQETTTWKGLVVKLYNTNNQLTNTLNNNYKAWNIRFDNGVVFDNYKIKVQLEKGKVKHSIVPYGSNYLVQTICGKNKYNINDTIPYTLNQNDGVTLTANSSILLSNYIPIEPNQTYKAQCNVTDFVYRAFFYDKNKKYIGNNTFGTTMSYNAHYVRLQMNKDFANANFQLEKDEVTKYEPYKETLITYDLQGNELCDIDGVRDKVDFVSGVLTKKANRYYFTGDEYWILSGGATDEKLVIAIPTANTIPFKIKSGAVIKSNHFIQNQSLNKLNTMRLYNPDSDGIYTSFSFVFDRSVYPTLEDGVQFLKDNQVYIDYPLAEPEIIQLEPTKIITYEGINNIYTESNVDVEEVDITYLTKSTLNQDFLGKAEYSIKENEINQKVSQKVGENEIIASINTAIKDEQGVVEFTGNSVIISADNMSVDKYGNLVCQNAVIRGGELILNDDGTHENAAIKIKTNKKIIKDIAITSDLNDSYLTQTFGDEFNFREAASQIIFTTDKNYQVKLLKTTVGSSSHVVGYTHQVVVSNNNDYNEIIYEVFHNQDEGIFTTNIDIQELQLPSEFGVVKTINSSTYLPYIKKLLINAGLTTYSSEGMEADIYSNYKYTRDDVVKVQNYLLDKVTLTNEEILFYDTNGDGKVTLSDWIVIQYNGGQYNVSDSQPGKFILDTTGINENLYVLDKDGNRIVSIGVTGAKVLTLNNPIFPDSYNEIEVGEALTYRNLESICGTWDDGKLIYRRVIHVENISATAIPNWSARLDLDIDIDTMVKIEGSYQVTGDAWTPINMPLSSSQAISTHYNADTKQLHIMSTFDISRGHIILEYTKN